MGFQHPDTIRQAMIHKFGLPADSAVGVTTLKIKEQRVDLSKRDLVIVATTTEIDSDDEVVVSSGADTSPFFKLRNIFVDHKYDLQHCIGKLRSASPIVSNGTQTGWLVRLHITDLPGNPLPNDILALASDGGVSSSIGFSPTDWGNPTPAEAKQYGNPDSIVRKWRWFELSITMFPCLLAAQQVGLPSADDGKAFSKELHAKRFDYLSQMLKANKICKESAIALGLEEPKAIVGKKKRIYIL